MASLFTPSDELFDDLTLYRKKIPSDRAVVGGTWKFELESRTNCRSQMQGKAQEGGIYLLFEKDGNWKAASKSSDFRTIQRSSRSNLSERQIHALLSQQHERISRCLRPIFQEIPSRFSVEALVNTSFRDRNVLNQYEELLFEANIVTRVRLKVIWDGFTLERKQWLFNADEPSGLILSAIRKWTAEFLEGASFSLRRIEIDSPTRSSVRFAPSAAATLIHELLGHPSESDCSTSYTRKLGMQRSDNAVLRELTVFDDPLLDKGAGFQRFDDDGELSRCTPLFKDGKFCGSLGSLRFPPTEKGGNTARKMNFSAQSMPRGTNLIVENGKDEVVFSSDILVIPSFSSGYVVPQTGEMQIVGSGCYFHVEGRKNIVGDVLINGDVYDCMSRLAAIHNDAELSVITCGKRDQWVQIGTKSPSLSFDNLEWQAPNG